MGQAVFANGRPVSSAGGVDIGHASVAVPNLCITPSPGGPVPIPFPNVGRAGTSGSKKVKVTGKSALKSDSKFSASRGGEAGTGSGKGLISAKNMDQVKSAATQRLQVRGFSQDGAKSLVEGIPVRATGDQIRLRSVLQTTVRVRE
jgi:hypothetical protein